MVQYVVLEPYHVANSLIHRLDPRLKLLATLAFVLVTTTLPPSAWRALAWLAIMVALLTAAARIPPSVILRRSLIVLPFVGMIALSLPFGRDGQTLWSVSVGGRTLALSDREVVVWATMVAKGWLSVLMAGLLVMTTPFPALLWAMQALRVPQILILIISFMYRYLFVLADEAMRMQRARLARSAGKVGGTLLWRIRVLGGMIGALFVRSYARSERIYQAMLSRGYDGRWFAPPLHWQRRDTWAGVLLAGGLALAGVLGVWVR